MKFGIKRKVGSMWELVRPPTAPPYEFGTREEAETMARILYPTECKKGGVIKVEPMEAS